MINRTVLVSVMVVVLSAVVKPHMAIIKLAVLLAVGVAGLYMVHLLAQDYRKIQMRPMPARFLFRRSIADSAVPGYVHDDDSLRLMSVQDELATADNSIPDLNTVLQYDPLGCARRYVCILATKHYPELSTSQRDILYMIRDISRSGRGGDGQVAFSEALQLGEKTRRSEACDQEYPKCKFSLTDMLNLIGVGGLF